MANIEKINEESLKDNREKNYDAQLDFVKTVTQRFLAQLPALDNRIAYVLTGNGVVLGVELFVSFSDAINKAVFYIPLLFSFLLLALSSIFSLIANMPGDFLVSHFGSKEQKEKIKEIGRIKLDYEYVKTLSRSAVLQKILESNNMMESVLDIKLKYFRKASYLLIFNFAVLLIMLVMRYWQMIGFLIK